MKRTAAYESAKPADPRPKPSCTFTAMAATANIWAMMKRRFPGRRCQTGGIKGLAHPGPPYRHTQHHEGEDSEAGEVLAQLKSQLGHHRGKEQVVKQLQPGGVPFTFHTLADA